MHDHYFHMVLYCVWKVNRDKKSTGCCSEGSNITAINCRTNDAKKKKGKAVLFHNQENIFFQYFQWQCSEEEKPCLSKYWKNMFS